MLELAPAPEAETAVRTTEEGTGVAQLIEAIETFRTHGEGTADRRSRAVEHWKQRLHALLGEHLLERAVEKSGGAGALESLARDVAERRVNPYTAVREMAARAGT
jgi:LAO/AO transport system kinase